MNIEQWRLEGPTYMNNRRKWFPTCFQRPPERHVDPRMWTNMDCTWSKSSGSTCLVCCTIKHAHELSYEKAVPVAEVKCCYFKWTRIWTTFTRDWLTRQHAKGVRHEKSKKNIQLFWGMFRMRLFCSWFWKFAKGLDSPPSPPTPVRYRFSDTD